MNDPERIKRAFARWCWPRRDELVPSSQVKPFIPKTWGERFEELHGESLEAYRARIKQAERRQA